MIDALKTPKPNFLQRLLRGKKKPPKKERPASEPIMDAATVEELIMESKKSVYGNDNVVLNNQDTIRAQNGKNYENSDEGLRSFVGSTPNATGSSQNGHNVTSEIANPHQPSSHSDDEGEEGFITSSGPTPPTQSAGGGNGNGNGGKVNYEDPEGKKIPTIIWILVGVFLFGILFGAWKMNWPQKYWLWTTKHPSLSLLILSSILFGSWYLLKNRRENAERKDPGKAEVKRLKRLNAQKTAWGTFKSQFSSLDRSIFVFAVVCAAASVTFFLYYLAEEAIKTPLKAGSILAIVGICFWFIGSRKYIQRNHPVVEKFGRRITWFAALVMAGTYFWFMPKQPAVIAVPVTQSMAAEERKQLQEANAILLEQKDSLHRRKIQEIENEKLSNNAEMQQYMQQKIARAEHIRDSIVEHARDSAKKAVGFFQNENKALKDEKASLELNLSKVERENERLRSDRTNVLSGDLKLFLFSSHGLLILVIIILALYLRKSKPKVAYPALVATFALAIIALWFYRGGLLPLQPSDKDDVVSTNPPRVVTDSAAIKKLQEEVKRLQDDVIKKDSALAAIPSVGDSTKTDSLQMADNDRPAADSAAVVKTPKPMPDTTAKKPDVAKGGKGRKSKVNSYKPDPKSPLVVKHQAREYKPDPLGTRVMATGARQYKPDNRLPLRTY